ncbi:hypothetical protein BH23VER1_BH23VER1_28890 [soil metagenome]
MGAAVVVLAVSMPACDDESPPSVPGNVFLEQRPPRYGHGGLQSPANRPPTVPQNQYGQRQSPTIYLDQPSRRTPPEEPAPQQTTPRQTTPRNDYSVVPQVGPPMIVDPDPDPEPTMVEADPEPKPDPKPEPKPDPKPKTGSGGLPYGVPVPGKPDYVYSPHDTQKRYVNVEGIPPGTEVMCPYSQKTFLVP